MCPYPMLKATLAATVEQRTGIMSTLALAIIENRGATVTKAEDAIKKLDALAAELSEILGRDERTYPRMIVRPAPSMSEWGYSFAIMYKEGPGAQARSVDYASTLDNAQRIARRYLERDRKARAAVPWVS